MVANDTGGADHPGIRGYPSRTAAHADPDQLRGARQRAALGAPARSAGLPGWACSPASRPGWARDIPRARKRAFGSVYQDITNLPEEIARAWLEPLGGHRRNRPVSSSA